MASAATCGRSSGRRKRSGPMARRSSTCGSTKNVPVSEFPILGFMPDAPANTVGALVSSSQVVPTERGIGGGVAVSNVTPAPVAGNPTGGFVTTLTDGSERIVFGAGSKLYAGNGADLSGATYNANVAQTWSFAQFGDMTLAVNKGDTVQSYSGTGTF